MKNERSDIIKPVHEHVGDGILRRIIHPVAILVKEKAGVKMLNTMSRICRDVDLQLHGLKNDVFQTVCDQVEITG